MSNKNLHMDVYSSFIRDPKLSSIQDVLFFFFLDEWINKL